MYAVIRWIIFSSLVILTFTPINAQKNNSFLPLTWDEDFSAQYPIRSADRIQLPAVNLEKLAEEDAQFPDGIRFAAPDQVDLGMKKGQWITLANGDRIWRLQIQKEGALGLAFFYDALALPPGSYLLMFGEDRTQQPLSYQADDLHSGDRFFTGITDGATATLEYYEPKQQKGKGTIHLFRVDYVYDAENYRSFNEFEFGASLECELNANCPEGDDWEKEKNSVCRIIVVVEEGTGYCSGSLLNNTNQDKTPYILSAFHCQDGFTPLYDLWRFDFNYASSGCENPATEPGFNSMSGSLFRAGRRENDFLLLEIADTIPDNFGVYYNGWNRSADPPTTSVSIHHPKGDIQKISVENDPATIFQAPINWDNGTTTPPNHHFRVRYEVGTFEPGSSGSPLLDPDGLVVGQLHGGNADECDNINAYFGRLRLSWIGGGFPENRLMDWLDPAGMDLDSLVGLATASVDTGSISGFVLTDNGLAISGVEVTLSSADEDPVIAITDDSGAYQFSGLPLNQNYGFALSKEGAAINGVSTLDLINIQKHIISLDTLGSPFRLLAADVNDSGSISTFDLIQIRKVILGIDLEFSNQSTWQFFPAAYNFIDPENPFLDTFPVEFQVTDFTQSLNTYNFIGVKTGDVNSSVDPTE